MIGWLRDDGADRLAPTLQPYLLLPLVAAFVYAAAALCLKIALARGTSTGTVLLSSNLILGAFFAPLLLTGSANWNLGDAPLAVVAGLLFFLGQVGTFRSLQSGDVSIATPALAAKVVFVALLSLLVPGSRPDPDLWLAVLLTAAGMALLHGGAKPTAARPWATLAWALLAALSFAAADILVQTGAPKAGFTLFMPVMFATVAAGSLPLLRSRLARRLPGAKADHARGWLAAGAFLIGVQAVCMASAIGLFGDATAANVVYGSRGLWSLLLLALFAKTLGINDAVFERRTLASRVAGSVLILVAVSLVLF